ncbi:hypothetical protein ACJX0J_037865, partial [Zea mays]
AHYKTVYPFMFMLLEDFEENFQRCDLFSCFDVSDILVAREILAVITARIIVIYVGLSWTLSFLTTLHMGPIIMIDGFDPGLSNSIVNEIFRSVIALVVYVNFLCFVSWVIALYELLKCFLLFRTPRANSLLANKLLVLADGSLTYPHEDISIMGHCYTGILILTLAN